MSFYGNFRSFWRNGTNEIIFNNSHTVCFNASNECDFHIELFPRNSERVYIRARRIFHRAKNNKQLSKDIDYEGVLWH